MSKYYKVKLHNWVNGVLQVQDQIFGTLAEAVNHAKKNKHKGIAKVLDVHGHIVHEETAEPTGNTYA